MKIKKYAIGYSLFMGVSMIGMWIVFYISGSIPELTTKPIELGMHVLAEITTAIFLIIGGLGLLKRRKWSSKIYFLSMGMLIYTLIMSPGYFLQKGELPFVLMFLVFFISAIILVIGSLINENRLNRLNNK